MLAMLFIAGQAPAYDQGLELAMPQSIATLRSEATRQMARRIEPKRYPGRLDRLAKRVQPWGIVPHCRCQQTTDQSTSTNRAK
jgi:hypothetical protein